MTTNLRVLIVEDDRSISRLLQLEMEHRRIVVETVFDGLAAIEEVARFAPDAIVLDILLPGMDGERILSELRRKGVHTPVIMLTARDKQHDKVRNLDLGADDYLTKPFDIEELLARLRAVLRRVERSEIFRIGELEIDAGTRTVRRSTRAIELTTREFDLLEFLARNSPRVLSRDLALEHVWSTTPDADPNVLDVYIGYLRRKIDTPGEPRLIHTVRGVGFALREQ